MTQFFDIRTLSVVMGVTIFVLGLSMVCYTLSRKTYAGFGAWTIGTILGSSALFLIALRHVLPNFITIVVANGLICSAFALFYLGFKSFAGKRGNPYLHIAIVLLLSLVLVPYFTYVAPSVNVRISLISFVGALYFLFSTRVLVREIQYDFAKLNKLLSGTLILLIILFVFRGIFFLLPGNTIDNFMSTGVIHGVALLAIIIFSMLFVIGLMQLNSQTLESELYREQGQLRESEERYRRLVEQSLQGLVVAQDNPMRLSFVSKPMEGITGYSQEELENFGPRQLLGLIHPEDREMFFRNFKDRLSGEEAPSAYECRFIHKTGGARWVEIYSSRIEDKDTLTTHTLFLDITERKQAEEEKARLEAQLQQAQKMEAIGTLAGGVAHDLNNILGGLVSYPELLLLQLPEESPLRKSILTIQKSGEKAAAVVQDLLTLARRGVVVTEVVNLSEIIAEYLKSPEHEKLQSYHPGVHIETHLEKESLNILGSPTHLSKTVMNLVSNAAEAMPEGGALIVSTENRYIDRPISGHDHVKEGDYVVLTVSDTGTGIASDDLEKIFEPFYTKKKMGRSGTGLGMAVVWGTVKDHNGYIHVESTEGKGTTFTLYFPVTRKSLVERSEISLKDYMGKGEAILVVDDVEAQRKIAAGMLKELGYSVVSVPSGEEAVEYFKTNKADLLVLDMIMDPGMDGLDTYRKIIELHPGQKAIIASGFSETGRAKALQGLGAGAYIRKPFLLEKIGIAVKGELEK
jgi:PAS domain S-box-containing protein